MKNALVSVIIPVYNVREYLDDCIRSILKQTYGNLEIILVDDGSTDDSGVLCDKYAKNDARIRVIHKLNGGLSDARNAGLDVATGEWVQFVDSDDWLEPDCVETLLDLCQRFSVEMSICGIRIVRGSKAEEKQFFLSGDTVYDARFALDVRNGCWNTAWNRLCKRTLYDGIRFPKGMINEDEGTTYKLLYQCKKFAGTGRCLYDYRIRPNSIMTSSSRMSNLDQIYLFYEKYNFFLARHEYVLADMSAVQFTETLLDKYRYSAEHDTNNRYELNDWLKKAKDTIRSSGLPLIKKVKYFCYCSAPRLFLLKMRITNGRRLVL